MLSREDVWKEGWQPLMTDEKTEEEAVANGCRYFYKSGKDVIPEDNLAWECIVYEWKDRDYSYIRLCLISGATIHFHMCFFPKNVKDFRKLMKLLNIKS